MFDNNLLIHWLKKFIAMGLLCVMAPVCHFVYAYFAWDDSVREFYNVLNAELQALVSMSNTHAGTILISLVEDAKEVVYSVSGVNDYTHANDISLTQDIVVAHWEYLQFLQISIQLIALRCGVIILSGPSIIGVIVVGLTNGVAIWSLRRSEGSRDSAFIYHRVKDIAYYCVVIFILMYFCPPVVMDPRLLVPIFSIYCSFFLTLTIGFFKKNL
jgi:Domain of unknown function (DUF4400)